ncbi:hypothetical protein CEW89_12305 [Celeribacter ethanolicus]|uniref:DUF4123 domain-containing protein n=1 Tax=Celeribacter ethanolicus TaxID=1758178 RepID=A0A291GDQ5_9RHOB|nr:DUF4123 domain-containing protein [Celeribacter ethanolicus]ATG48278.1 hypothetical protein CEW89_12305 [Celeribacter ethanolicus]
MVGVTIDQFLSPKGSPAWLVLDGVNCPDLSHFLGRTANCCFYRETGQKQPIHAPWMISIDDKISEMASFLPNDTHWGFIFTSHWPIRDLRAHFRRYTMLKTPQNEAPVYFRFYDPRVLFDLSHALEAEKLRMFMRPFDRLALPLSPLLGERCGLSPLAHHNEFRSKFLTLPLPPAYPPESGSQSFQIGTAEYRRFESLQARRAERKLARELHLMARNRSDTEILDIAAAAPARAARYDLTSVRQIRLFANCMLKFGITFDESHPGAREVLTLRWASVREKFVALQNWYTTASDKSYPAQASQDLDIWDQLERMRIS